MKVLVCGDVHWSEFSSILRRRGETFSERLENCIQSVNWVERLAEEQHCEYIIYLGDFFDKETLNSAEITALQNVQWSNIKKIMLVGNHEMGTADLSKSSAHLFNLIPNATVIDSPNGLVGFGYRLLFLPYVLQSDRRTVAEYWKEVFSGNWETQELKRTYIFSHNDIRGIQMGKFLSEDGFEISDIESMCDLCLNGHLHNGGNVTSKIINVGNLTGQNFGEDATKYKHQVALLDTDTNSLDMYENPVALHFYKLEVMSESDLQKLLSCLKQNCVISVKCIDTLVKELRAALSSNKNVLEYRIITVSSTTATEVEETIQNLVDTDHISQFMQYVLATLGATEIVNSELQRMSR